MPASHLVAASPRDLAEIARSAREAETFASTSVNRSQIERYLNPPANTPYGLEYAFYLAGDIRGKTVVDLGCGKGENLVPLAERGASVIGIDISPDLVRLAEKRVHNAGVQASVMVGSAYAPPLPAASVDLIFCIALIHHLDVPRVREEMLRILKKGGCIVLSEPIRFSAACDRTRKRLTLRALTSEYEHPLTKAEFECMTSGLAAEDLRFFRLPFVPLADRVFRHASHRARTLSAWMIDKVPGARHFATSIAVRLRK